MNVLFVLLSYPANKASSNLYSDLVEEFFKNGHAVTVIAPTENDQKPGLYNEDGIKVMRVKTLQSQGVSSVIKKGLALTLMPIQFRIAYKKFLSSYSYDLILMPTPPITLVGFVEYVLKKNKNAIYYLILRDIHPHSSRSIGMCNNPIMFRFLNNRAQKAYRIADYIGCMSQGNIDFVHSIAKKTKQVSLCLLPNWLKEENVPQGDIAALRKKLGLEDKIVALFGGTIGVGQGVENIVNIAKYFQFRKDVAFLVVGKGIRKQKLIDLAQQEKLKNIVFVDFLPRDEYQLIMELADIGLISLDRRYTVPTCPSKAIAYMSRKKPIFAMINKGSDYGQTYIDTPCCGFWTDYSNGESDYEGFTRLLDDYQLRNSMGLNGYDYYKNNFLPENAYSTIIQQIKI